MTESAPQDDPPLNPADELHRLLTSWRVIPSHQPGMAARGGELGYWDNTIRAIELLEQCVEQQKRQIAGTKRELNEQAVDRMRRAVLCTKYSMEDVSPNTREVINRNDLDLLDSWASGWHSTPGTAEELLDFVEARDLAAEITTYLEGASNLTHDNQQYLLLLSRSLQDALRDFGNSEEGNIASLASQLAVALGAFTPATDKRRTEFIARLGRTAAKVMSKGIGPVYGAYAGVLTTQHASQITQAVQDLGHALGG